MPMTATARPARRLIRLGFGSFEPFDVIREFLVHRWFENNAIAGIVRQPILSREHDVSAVELHVNAVAQIHFVHSFTALISWIMAGFAKMDFLI